MLHLWAIVVARGLASAFSPVSRRGVGATFGLIHADIGGTDETGNRGLRRGLLWLDIRCLRA
jgi:hypothetical protein